ncbi:hypothetical protein ACFB49_45420 [Sphingomonas sp. DBB INV C78]|uniref:peptidoglycan-binding protein n=1 Tax=Sphingomonas sp. DBB INV C78 TaxID=3349434 RepID=UPI0036D2FBA4
MISRIDSTRLDTQQKAELIFQQARSELSNRLWQAALGGEATGGTERSMDAAAPEFSMDSLLAVLETGQPAAPRATLMAAPPQPRAFVEPDEERSLRSSYNKDGVGGLGVNSVYAGTLKAAAERTGIPAAALAAIVHAESAKGADGRWLVYSRNPRSSAAGLGQFLSGTWQGETERRGSWLNATARDRGWLDTNGKVRAHARAELLALRYDGDASIQAIADYSRSNLDKLKRVGVDPGAGEARVAELAYLGHHLGLGDAIRYLKGGLDPERARLLLDAQVGRAAAEQRISAAGDAPSAHRAWLNDYVGRNLQTARFQKDVSVG